MRSANPSTAVNAMTPARLGWSAAIVTGASLLHLPHLPLWIPMLLLATLGWRILGALRGWPRPASAIRIVLAFATFAIVLVQFRTFSGLEAGSALLVVMVALKFVEARSQRDQLVLMIISYFLVFASLLHDRGSLTIAWLFAFVFVTTVGLLQLGRRGPMLPARPTARLAGRLLLQAVPVMVVLFVLFPRLPGPLWGMPAQPGAGARTGLSDTMSPGDLSELGLSQEVAFRVEFRGREPEPSDLYWRGPVLDNFNRRTWSASQTPQNSGPDALAYFGQPLEYRVLLEPQRRNWVFALEMPASWSGLTQIRMDRNFQLHASSPARSPARISYEAVSYPDYRTLEPLSATERLRLLRLPDDSSPRTRALVAGWVADDPQPRAIVNRALALFSDAPFQYTLTPPLLGQQPVDEFVFGTRAGFCEHYASALAVMMRAAGIPARVVTGYHGGERNPLGGYLIVRQSDAHAWTEVWLDDAGWVRVDPTAAVAPERISLGSGRSALGGIAAGGIGLGSWQLWWRLELARDAADRYWNQWVMGYGPQLQRALLETWGLGRMQAGGLLALALIAATICLVAVSLWMTVSGRRTAMADPPSRLFSEFCRRLERRAVAARAPGEGPVAFGRRAAAALPHAREQINGIVAAYLAARYEPDREYQALRVLTRRVKQFSPRSP